MTTSEIINDLKIRKENNLGERPSKDAYYLMIAETVSLRSTCLRRKYGAVIVKDDEIIATGYNGSPRGDKNCCDLGLCQRETMHVPHGERYELCHSVHAEQNALLSASRKAAKGATLYLYGYDCIEQKTIDAAPCLMCERFIKNAGIARIICSTKSATVKNEEEANL